MAELDKATPAEVKRAVIDLLVSEWPNSLTRVQIVSRLFGDESQFTTKAKTRNRRVAAAITGLENKDIIQWCLPNKADKGEYGDDRYGVQRQVAEAIKFYREES